MPGVAEARARHDRERHDADGARRPCVNGGDRRDNGGKGDRQSHQQEAQGNEKIAHVEDRDQGLTEGAVAPPAREADEMQHTRDATGSARDEAGGRKIQASKAIADNAMVVTSNLPNGAGKASGPRLASQFRVKLGRCARRSRR